jgi:hypothetical protein
VGTAGRLCQESWIVVPSFEQVHPPAFCSQCRQPAFTARRAGHQSLDRTDSTGGWCLGRSAGSRRQRQDLDRAGSKQRPSRPRPRRAMRGRMIEHLAAERVAAFIVQSPADQPIRAARAGRNHAHPRGKIPKSHRLWIARASGHGHRMPRRGCRHYGRCTPDSCRVAATRKSAESGQHRTQLRSAISNSSS